MVQIFKKEISLFFSSITGFIALSIFLIASALIAFVFPETSVLDYGFATLDSFFNSAPYIFLFLIPAITMRSFAEERSSKTLELLQTKPLRLLEIIGGKYLSAVTIVLLALLPTLLYPYIICQLAEPVNNIDAGAYTGSMIGLLCLAFCFCAIGLFGSSLSKNQVVAFIIAMFLCFLSYFAFSSISNIPWLIGKSDYIIQQIGLESHYLSMSKGLVSLRDVLYFFSVMILFLYFTFLRLQIESK